MLSHNYNICLVSLMKEIVERSNLGINLYFPPLVPVVEVVLSVVLLCCPAQLNKQIAISSLLERRCEKSHLSLSLSLASLLTKCDNSIGFYH